MNDSSAFLGVPRCLIGMVHLAALPGSPRSELRVSEIARQAVIEAKLLEKAGFDAILIENMNDLPYLRRNVGSEITAAMTACALSIRAAVEVPIGLQILAGANCEAMSAAHACGASFIRAEGFALAAIADEGIFDQADAGPLLRHRKMLGAERVLIAADVLKKHSSHAITSDLSAAEQTRTLMFCGADAVIVTGSATGQPVNFEQLGLVKEVSRVPVLVGSGARADNVSELLEIADAIIVGSDLKRGGRWQNPIDPARAKAFVKAARR
ncbi:MAG: BtpA/SgcQ family protein [Planctomycetes bacterium]|nr:BtpA/SgcQ family protein [Planctomycetota bacterium]